MCHDYFGRARERETVTEEDEDEEELPSYLNEEPAEDVELLTDGGDE